MTKKEKQIKKLNPLFFQGVAHRGLHDNESTENSLGAFKKAVEANSAIEFDVHLTKDNKLVVVHDSQLQRVTGKEGIVEDLTVEEIKNNYNLLDGSLIPTLQELLDLVQEKVPMVLEIKSYKNNWKEIAKQVKKELNGIKNKNNVVIISFDPRALLPLSHKGYIRQLLVCEEYKDMFKYRHFFEALDVDKKLVKQEEYQKYRKNHLVNCWTIRSEEELDDLYDYIDMATFELFSSDIVKKKYS